MSNDGEKDGKHDISGDGDTGRRGNDEDHSTKIDPKKYEQGDGDR
ncbi:hypothetical protein [Amycolatopsis samaneae]|uniref:Uncharacterized protein n=1 Tax=Amycolatopsis samaneae TaxID=664691 RepID=A0ABW5GHB8_9PSEU